MGTNTIPKRVKLPVAAEAYGVSVKTLRRYIASGQITGYRMGKRIILVDLNELESSLVRTIPSAGGERIA